MSTVDIDLSIQPTESLFEITKEVQFEELPPQKVRGYLYALREAVLTALITMYVAIAIGVPALCGLIEFLRSGSSFMHPYLAMFLALGSIGLFAVSLISAFKVKSQLQTTVGRLLRIYYEMR